MTEPEEPTLTALTDLEFGMQTHLADDDVPEPNIIEWPNIQWTGIPAIALERFQTEGALTAAADVQTGAMVAFVLRTEDAQRFIVPGGEPLEELHITCMYLGDAANLDDDDRKTIFDVVGDFVEDQSVFMAKAFALSAFNPNDESPCLTVILSGNDLATAHAQLTTSLDENGIMEPPDAHAPWIPHMTLIYVTDPELQITSDLKSALGVVVIDRVRVAFAGEVTDFPLDDSLTAAMLDAFHMPGAHDQATHGHGGVSGDAALAACPSSIVHTDAEEGLTTAQVHALRRYRRNGYVDTNRHLRGQGIENATQNKIDATTEDIGLIDSAMASSHLTQDVTVVRGIRNDVGWLGAAAARSDLTGVEFTDKGFVSTSADPKIGRSFSHSGGMTMTVTVPRGTPAIALSSMNMEGEILLDRGLRYRITADHGTQAGRRIVDVEVVQ